jgi:C4-dicarboxylate-specific signal transduction histidine kinase
VDEALSGQIVTLERRLPYARAGMRDVVISYIPDIRSGGRVQGFYVLVNDVTPIKDSERRERQRMLELAHVSRLASLGEMASEIAHEINQPLAAIAMYSSACLRTAGRDDGSKEGGQMNTWLEAINAQAKRAGEVVRRLRHFVRKGEIQPGPVDLNQVAREVVALMRFDADWQNIAIELDLAEGMPNLSAELILVEQVLFNLVRNAFEAKASETEKKRVLIRTRFDQAYACIEVEDNGLGVNESLGNSIFESFMTDKQNGLGMGLAISRSIVEAHGGTLGYVNNPQGGATFRCCLPREDRHE